MRAPRRVDALLAGKRMEPRASYRACGRNCMSMVFMEKELVGWYGSIDTKAWSGEKELQGHVMASFVWLPLQLPSRRCAGFWDMIPWMAFMCTCHGCMGARVESGGLGTLGALECSMCQWLSGTYPALCGYLRSNRLSRFCCSSSHESYSKMRARSNKMLM